MGYNNITDVTEVRVGVGVSREIAIPVDSVNKAKEMHQQSAIPTESVIEPVAMESSQDIGSVSLEGSVVPPNDAPVINQTGNEYLAPTNVPEMQVATSEVSSPVVNVHDNFAPSDVAQVPVSDFVSEQNVGFESPDITKLLESAAKAQEGAALLLQMLEDLTKVIKEYDESKQTENQMRP